QSPLAPPSPRARDPARRPRGQPQQQQQQQHYFQPRHVGMAAADAAVAPSAAAGPQPSTSPPLSSSTVANVVVARGLDRAPRAVQVQALELVRARRAMSRSAVLVAPP